MVHEFVARKLTNIKWVAFWIIKYVAFFSSKLDKRMALKFCPDDKEIDYSTWNLKPQRCCLQDLYEKKIG